MKKATEKQWTVMVYLAGDNNLDRAGAVDLGEMKAVGSTDAINVIAQFDRSGKTRETKRYYLRKGGPLARDAVAGLGETNTGDPAVLQSFVDWGIKSYPARHYALVVWNHGNGWDDEDVYRVAKDRLKLAVTRRGKVVSAGVRDGSVSIRRLRAVAAKPMRRALFGTTVEGAVRQRGIAYDDNAKDFLDNLEMKRVLTATARKLGRKIDILGMDACLMSMAEVLYQLRESVGLSVGSEEVEPGDGWPYDKILADLARNPDMKPRDLASAIVKRYVASYAADDDVTQAACDLSKAGELADVVDRLAKALIAQLDDPVGRAAIIQARASVQSYDTPDYVDLQDFCELVAQESGHAGCASACAAVESALGTSGFVVRSGYKGKKVEHSNGLSIYFPQKTVSPLYKTLDFTKKTSWPKFLERYLAGIRGRRGAHAT
jgi:Clostripain family